MGDDDLDDCPEPWRSEINRLYDQRNALEADNERLRAALELAQNLMCAVATETRDLGLVEGDTNAALQSYCRALEAKMTDTQES